MLYNVTNLKLLCFSNMSKLASWLVSFRLTHHQRPGLLCHHFCLFTTLIVDLTIIDVC